MSDDDLRADAARVLNSDPTWTDYLTDETGEEHPEDRPNEGWHEAARRLARDRQALGDRPPTPTGTDTDAETHQQG